MNFFLQKCLIKCFESKQPEFDFQTISCVILVIP